MPPPNQPPPQESGSNKNNNENSNKNNNENNNNDDKNQKLQSTLETLHREMDVAEYTKIRGQNRRVTRKDLSLQRTRKRKALEKEDYETMMEENELLDINMPIAFIKKQKLRGSKKVLEEDVLEASLPLNNSSFANYAAASAVQEDEDEDEEENDEEEEEELDEEELDEEEKELEEEEENEQDQEENELGDENDDQENDDYQNQQEQQKEDLKTESEQKQPEESQKQPPNSTNITNTTTSQKKPPPSNSQKGKKRGPYKKKIGKKSSDQKQVRGKRRLFKLKNFKSFKMAQRHGDALGAHARGQHRLAIAQLQQVAKDAPSAPQVYSSLGMVYHDMYQSCWKKVSSLMQEQQQQQEEQTQTQMTDTRNGIVQEAMNVSSPTNTADITTATATAAGDTVTTTKTNSDANTNAAALNKYIPIQYQEPLHLAQKAYGSYHIAAILCKKDYSLWLRAADTACDIAYLYGQLPRLSSNIDNPLLFQTLVAEQQTRWYKEAQRDYQTADNLHPPGIDVPTKLAAVHMELGQLSEALTIWTDLVQQSAKAQSQSQSQIQFHHTAWKLYADCLLQIGYECQEFNNGKDQNKNYMFRRWLKKFAAEFNWKERRLQALVLALEAAAGSHACRALMEWMRQRAIRMSASVSASASNGGNSSGNSSEKKKTVETAATDDTTTTDKPQQEINEQEFEKEKQLLLKRNEEELAAFDQTTENMMEVLQNDVIEGSKASKDTAVEERQAQRSKMTESQKAQVDQLDGEYQEARKDPSKEQVESSSPAATSNENKEAPGQDPSPATLAVESSPSLEQRNMPLSASSGEVSRIAAELMKLMLSTDLYQGARLVGEAVSLYLRERAQLHDKRTTARRRLDESSNMFGGSLFSTKFQTYDEIHEDLSDDEDLENAYISDEEELMNNDSLLNSLRHGVLPPEISVLYALCLIQEGGRNFIAKKCMDSLAYLVQEPVSWLTENRDVDSGLSKDPSWLLFRLIATEPLGRTAAFALLADVLHKSGKEEETTWSTHFAPLFGQCLEDLKRDRMLDVLHNNATGSLFPILKYRRDMLYKIILGFGRLKIQSAKANLTRAQEKGDNELVNESVRSIWDCLKSLKEYLSIPAQKPLRGAYGSLSAVEIETLELFTCGHTLLLKQGEAVLDQSTLEEVSNESDRVIAWLCGTGHAANSADEAFNSTRIMNWKSFPISSTWQSPKQKAMSLRCYNLCVAHNVSHFSGWDLHEFSLGLINQKGSSDAAYFGLHLEGEVVSGFLPATVEQELMHQWNRLSELESVGFALDLSKTLADVKERQWYKDGLPKYQDALHGGITAKNCEGPGLEFFLAYSGACLDLAQNKERDDESIKRLLIMNCLSILLPITQFCLEKTIWSSDIGKLALRKHKEEGWRQISRKKSASSTPAAKPPRRNRSTKLPSKSFVEWFHEEDAEDPMSNVVTIPASQLKSLWGPFANSTPEQAKQVMAGVHESMVTLRASRANANVEKASLQVAVALLQLVKEQCCENPFIVLQQAAIFASHGSKRGNNDAMFREALPEPTKCTPEDALTILGRADCFLSVQFPYESAFLCNYVARVCSSQRKSKEQWNNQWMVVGILCYHLSVLIRSSAETVLGELFKKEDYDPWDEDIVDELLQGRADALQWKMGDEYGNLVVSQMQIDDAVFEVQADDDLPSRQIAL